ncbi:MAG: 50S ribosomal protein L3 [Planctomycetota bacterium]|jgi:large subunit ribosomal protein L3|nr:50S ribosomal protein L3 [Planctomycetota bacterium]
MWRGILGRKIGMTQFFTADGRRMGVTVVEAGPCPVLQLKTKDKDGYDAYQLGFDDKKAKNASMAAKGHAAKTGNAPKRFIREIRLREAIADLEPGKILTIGDWSDIKEVQVTAKSKGKGFQGVIKRHGFHGLRATHGVKTHHRIPGSSGALTPTRVVKGHPNPGHMGCDWVTQKGLTLAKVIPEKNLLLIRGSVPGPNGGYVIIRPAQPFVPEKD